MKTLAQITACVLIACLIGTFALKAIDQSDRDLSLPPKPVPKVVETFLLWIPFAVGIAISGNAHAPSQAGVSLGFYAQCAVVGIAFFVITRIASHFVRKRKYSRENA